MFLFHFHAKKPQEAEGLKMSNPAVVFSKPIEIKRRFVYTYQSRLDRINV